MPLARRDKKKLVALNIKIIFYSFTTDRYVLKGFDIGNFNEVCENTKV